MDIEVDMVLSFVHRTMLSDIIRCNKTHCCTWVWGTTRTLNQQYYLYKWCSS